MTSLWARITGKDNNKTYPEQQSESLDSAGNVFIISPYGLYTNLPEDAFLRKLDEGTALSATVKRPSDNKRGEPVFYHPETNTRIIARNDGTLDIETGNGGTAPVNIKCTQLNVTATEYVTFDTPDANFTGNIHAVGDIESLGDIKAVGDITARFGTGNDVGVATHRHTQPNDSNGDSEQPTNAPTAGS